MVVQEMLFQKMTGPMDKGVSGRRFVQGGWNPSSYKQFRTFQTVVQFSETVESKTTFKSLLCNCSNGLILPSFQTTRVQIISSFCFTFFVFRDFRMGKYVHVAFFLFFHSMIRWFPQVELHKASAPLSHIQAAFVIKLCRIPISRTEMR